MLIFMSIKNVIRNSKLSIYQIFLIIILYEINIELIILLVNYNITILITFQIEFNIAGLYHRLNTILIVLQN